MEKYIKSIDLQRSSYYNFFTGQEQGFMEHCALCFNSTTVGYDLCVELIANPWETNQIGE